MDKNAYPKSNETFDFVFSFAGEDRNIVELIRTQLAKKGYRIFYDYDYQAHLVGKDLYRTLRDLYKNKGTYVVCFISENYEKKEWTNLEFTAIKERLLATFFANDFLIPILLDDTCCMEDIPSFFGFYRHRTVKDTCELLDHKFQTTLTEDYYTDNLKNCMDYICRNIVSRLKEKKIDVSTHEHNKICVRQAGNDYIFEFCEESIAAAPCLLFYSNTGGTREEIEIPTFLIYWTRAEGISFNIHNFTEHQRNIETNLSLSCLVDYISNFILQYVTR